MNTRFAVRGLVICLIICAASHIFAQNLLSDVRNNNLDGAKAKIELLKPKMDAEPYIDEYLAGTHSYSPPMLALLVKSGAKVDQVNSDGFGPLYYAIKNGFNVAVKDLISAGARVNVFWKTRVPAKISVTGSAFLGYYPSQDDLQAARRFASDIGALSKSAILFSTTPLLTAFLNSNFGACDQLITSGADPFALIDFAESYLNPSGEWVKETSSVIQIVASVFAVYPEKNVSLESFFAGRLIWGKAVSQQTAKNSFPLKTITRDMLTYIAAGDIDGLKVELASTSDDTRAYIPFAILSENWNVLNLFLQYTSSGINSSIIRVDKEDESEDSGALESPIAFAIREGDKGAVKMLLDHGAKIPDYIKTETDESFPMGALNPLAFACRKGDVEMVKFLLNTKADPNQGTPLRYTHRYPEIRDLLVASGADIMARYSAYYSSYRNSEYGTEANGNSLLLSAVENGSPESVAWYLDKGIDPNLANSIGMSPLLSAIIQANSAIVSILLKNGADYKKTFEDPAIEGQSLIYPYRDGDGEAREVNLDDYKDLGAYDIAVKLFKEEYNNQLRALRAEVVRILGDALGQS